MSFGRILPDWPAPPGVMAFSTTREGGASTGPWASLNLGANCGDEPENVAQNRQLINRSLPSPVRWLRQVHGTTVVQQSGETGIEPEADAVVSDRPARVCAVLTADCLPVFFCNRSGDRVGIAHAGWRGLAAGVLQSTIEALGESPDSLMAWLGPAIGPAAYEVGGEVVRAFPDERSEVAVPHGDRFLLDLYAIARLKLEAAGIGAVYGGGLCTFSDAGRFYSFRRDGVTGRMANLIWIEE